MSLDSEYSVFASLRQAGPLAVGSETRLDAPFSAENRLWVKNLGKSDYTVAKYRALRRQIFDILGVESFREIAALIALPERQEEQSCRVYARLGNMFGMTGTAGEIAARVQEYARAADAVINSLKGKIFADYASHIALTNEIEVTSDPVRLLLICFDDRYHKKARFEARRKLQLMNLAGSIDQRERETRIEEKFLAFLSFLNDFVWSHSQKIGEHDIVYLLSQHRPEDYSCAEARVLSATEACQVKPGAYEKLTLLKRRRFETDGETIPIYVSIRKKPPEAKILKLLRKNEKNPAVAVDDELGLMAVLDSQKDIRAFQKHLTQSALRADSFMVLEDISDTLSGSAYRSSATGSSAQTPMLKFFARLGGMRVEFIIHTNRTWLNYMYRRDVAHDEYEVKRIFDSGVAEILFPQDIFALDHPAIRQSILEHFRRKIELT
ncbi:MAG: hypothetical protein LBU39_04970 [Desulfobulbaceae bacterium]|jgi:hypothetical protein|nr:hypothetical protein [Desulfobulbaceae bacterium]